VAGFVFLNKFGKINNRNGKILFRIIVEINDLKCKMVAVLGFGQEGKAVTTYLLKHGIKPVLFDARPWDEWEEKDKQYIRDLGVNFIFHPDWLKEFKGFDVAFRSPGIRLVDINEATKKLRVKPTVTSQTKWFFEHCSCRIIGVTGTKGKGTTATLISEILKSKSQTQNSKFHTYLTGNIGNIQPFEILDDLKQDDWVVYELSSFQLQDLERSPHIGVVLMTTSEHLDYHSDTEEYLQAKMPIVKFQSSEDFAVINADYPGSMEIGQQGSGEKYYLSRKGEVEKGCYVKDGQLIVKNVANKNFQFPISNFKLRGEHNLENISAAVIAGALAEADKGTIIKVVSDFKGLEHRLEFVAEKNGIKFYNDSFSTTPETAIAAIRSFTEPLIVILGGSSKNADFSELAKEVATAENIKALILVGQEASKIKEAVGKVGKFKGHLLEGARSMEEIFKQIKKYARSGDVVLLSPACASFGMFKNYKDRGEQFKIFVGNFE